MVKPRTADDQSQTQQAIERELAIIYYITGKPMNVIRAAARRAGLRIDGDGKITRDSA